MTTAIDIWTDGSAGVGKKGGWAAILESGDKRKELFGPLENITGNNMAEMIAIHMALLAVKCDGALINIFTDNANAIGWLSQNWKCNVPEIRAIVLNTMDLIRDRKFSVVYHHVRGHAGNPNNERADQLAGEAMRTGQVSMPETKPVENRTGTRNFGMTVTITRKWLGSGPDHGKTYRQVFNNVTEIHWNYPSPRREPHVAFESDIHGTGYTMATAEIVEMVSVPATTLADKF